jgi:hypothetical protein
MGGHRLFTAIEDAALAVQYQNGVSAVRLAKQHGCTVGAILNALRRDGVVPRSVPRMTRDDVAEAHRLYMSGLPFKRVGERMGRSEATITRAIHAAYPESVRSRYKRGAESPTWKGGRMMHHGYVYVRQNGGYVLEHRKTLSEHLGRPLLPTETVHHINGDKTDNRIENLQLRQGKHGKHIAMKCLNCGSLNVGPVLIEDC